LARFGPFPYTTLFRSTISSVSKAINLDFQRVQFTPDLLPTDLIGTMIFNPKTGDFAPKKGPIFTNIVLADEINRAPAKVQSALLDRKSTRLNSSHVKI